jgi:hypothetical protein
MYLIPLSSKMLNIRIWLDLCLISSWIRSLSCICFYALFVSSYCMVCPQHIYYFYIPDIVLCIQWIIFNWSLLQIINMFAKSKICMTLSNWSCTFKTNRPSCVHEWASSSWRNMTHYLKIYVQLLDHWVLWLQVWIIS